MVTTAHTLAPYNAQLFRDTDQHTALMCVKGASTHSATEASNHPGTFLGSIVEADQSRDGYELETFYYHRSGQALAYTYAAPLYSALSVFSSTTTWNVPSEELLRQWVKQEQLAAGLRQAYRNQSAKAQQQGRENVPALQRLLTVSEMATQLADAHTAAPLVKTPEIHGLHLQS